MKQPRGARLGQHFLKHRWAASALAHAAPLHEGDIFLEIGPGKGILTRELLSLGRVIAVEKDEVLVDTLRETFAEECADGRLRIIPEDIRDVTPESLGLRAGAYVVAANIPYYITGEILRTFLSAESPPRAMALLVQKEVAQRATSAKESMLSLSVKAYGQPRIIKKVPRSHFSPPPSVDSAILLIEHISKDFFSGINEDAFFSLARAGFASKRKQLAGNLTEHTGMAREQLVEIFSRCRIAEDARAETVSLQQWKELVRELATADSSRAS